MSVGPRFVARRTALAVGVAAFGLAGCDDGDSDEPGSVSTPAADPDADLVDEVLTDLGHAEQLALGAGLPGLAALHRAHIEALEGPEAALPVTASQKTVRRNEFRLQRVLVDAAMTAESGALARLFASMGAAYAQRLTRRPV